QQNLRLRLYVHPASACLPSSCYASDHKLRACSNSHILECHLQHTVSRHNLPFLGGQVARVMKALGSIYLILYHKLPRFCLFYPSIPDLRPHRSCHLIGLQPSQTLESAFCSHLSSNNLIVEIE